jgi:hypothetical protein
MATTKTVFPFCFLLLTGIGMAIAQGICALGRLCGLDWSLG